MAMRQRKDSLFYRHEALDRAFLAAQFFDQNVHSHSYVQFNSRLKKQADKLTERLWDFYQLCAEEDLKADD